MGVVAGTLALAGGYLLGNGINRAAFAVSESVNGNVKKACFSLEKAFHDHGELLAEGARQAGCSVAAGTVLAAEKLRLYESAFILTKSVKEVAVSIGTHAEAVQNVARSIENFKSVVEARGAEFTQSVAEMNRILATLVPSFGQQIITAIEAFRRTGFELITYFFALGSIVSAVTLYLLLGRPVDHLHACTEFFNALYLRIHQVAQDRPAELAMNIFLFSAGALSACIMMIWRNLDLHIKRTMFELQLLNAIQVDAVKQTIQMQVESIPVGCVVGFSGEYPGQGIPGWLLCDGAVVNEVRYPLLTALIRNMFDSGGGALRLPDLRSRMIIGAVDGGCGDGAPPLQLQARPRGSYAGQEQVGLTVANLPPHEHPILHSGQHAHRIHLECGAQATLNFLPGSLYSQVTSSFENGRRYMEGPFIEDAGHHTHECQAVGFGQPFSLTPPCLALNYIIRAA